MCVVTVFNNQNDIRMIEYTTKPQPAKELAK